MSQADNQVVARLDGGGARVLVVEDEPIVALDLKRMLEASGFLVTGVATQLREGVQMALSLPLDVALLDVRLSQGTTSRELARILRRRGVPVLLVTAHVQPGRQGEFDEAYADCPLLAKPFGKKQLLEAVQGLL